MKKRIAFALCMILMVLMLVHVEQTRLPWITMESPIQIFSLKWIPMRAWYRVWLSCSKKNKLTADTLPDDVKDQLTSSYGVTEAQIEAAAKWQDTLDEFGEMKKIEDDTFEVTKSGKTLTT